MPHARRALAARLAVVVSLIGIAMGSCSVFRPLIRPFITPFSVNRIDPGFEMPSECVMVFYVDGLKKDVLEEMARAGELPLIKKYILDRAASVDHAVTCIPSLTYANATSMVCGLLPGHHDVAGNKWFDRERLVYRNYESRSTMTKINTDLRAPTIYEILDDKLTAVVGMQLNKGAKLHFVTETGDGGLPAGVAWSLGYQEEVDTIMAENIADLGREARCLRHWPDLSLIYFPGPDDVAHFNGWNSPRYRSSLRSLDDSLGSVLRALDEGGVLDRLTLVLVSDHGFHDVLARNFVDPARLLCERAGVPASGAEGDLDEEVPWLDGENEASWRSRERRFRNQVAVVAHSGERFAAVHLRSGADWSERPTAEQILWFHRGGKAPADGGATQPLPAILVGHPAVAIAGVREGADAVQLFGKGGTARVERQVSETGPRYRYTVTSGADPLYEKDGTPGLADGGFHDSREWLAATAALSHPDVVAQICEVFDHRRGGDLVLFAAPGWDFSSQYVGGHGGIELDEMTIPLYFAGPRIAPGTRIPAARLVDLVPTVLDLMGVGDRATGLCRLDGVSLAPAVLGADSRPAPAAK